MQTASLFIIAEEGDNTVHSKENMKRQHGTRVLRGRMVDQLNETLFKVRMWHGRSITLTRDFLSSSFQEKYPVNAKYSVNARPAFT